MKTLVFFYADGSKRICHVKNSASPWDMCNDYHAERWEQMI
jgi:hypothetical protein